jgi:hypothetical protein
MAEVIITSCDDYARALQMVTMQNQCDPTAIDWTPNGGGWPTGSTWNTADYSVGGTGHTGNGTCAMFDPRGGGMIFKPLPTAALATPHTGAYTAATGGGANEDAFAGYPLFSGANCIAQTGTCPLGNGVAYADLLLMYPYLNYNTCSAIDRALNLNFNPSTNTVNPDSDYYYSLFNNFSLRNPGQNSQTIAHIGPNAGTIQGCALDNSSNSHDSAYVYMCALMIR